MIPEFTGNNDVKIGILEESKLIRGNFQNDGVLIRTEIIEGKIRFRIYKHIETFFANVDELREALKE